MGGVARLGWNHAATCPEAGSIDIRFGDGMTLADRVTLLEVLPRYGEVTIYGDCILIENQYGVGKINRGERVVIDGDGMLTIKPA